MRTRYVQTSWPVFTCSTDLPLVFDRTCGLSHRQVDNQGNSFRDEDSRIDDSEEVQMHNAYTVAPVTRDRIGNDNAASLLA
jgi:hypothetical protein